MIVIVRGYPDLSGIVDIVVCDTSEEESTVIALDRGQHAKIIFDVPDDRIGIEVVTERERK